MSVAPRFSRGSQVRVRVDSPPGHIRTPAYVQGKTGRVEGLHGEFCNPESLAYGGDGLPRRPLYLVGFGMDHVWEDAALSGHRVYVDLYEHWLEPVSRTEDD